MFLLFQFNKVCLWLMMVNLMVNLMVDCYAEAQRGSVVRVVVGSQSYSFWAE